MITVDLRTVGVVQHLLWHKAMAQPSDDGAKITEYVRLVEASDDGEHVSMRDPFHRDIAIAFELVIREHMDPWDLDLSKFAQLYLQEAKERGVELVTAGRIILMAWTVLKLQSDEVADRAVIEPESEMGWDDLPDWDMEDDAWDFTQRVKELPEAPIDEKIRHKGDRRVTLMELLSAFEEIHGEAEERKRITAQKQSARLSLRRKMRGRVGGNVHREDLQADVAETWQRIMEHPAQPIPFSGLHENQRVDCVQTFNALLYLTKERRIDVLQDDFPRGEIWITPLELPVGDVSQPLPSKGEDGGGAARRNLQANGENVAPANGTANHHAASGARIEETPLQSIEMKK